MARASSNHSTCTDWQRFYIGYRPSAEEPMQKLRKVPWTLLVLCSICTTSTLGQRCGVERWSVKTGTDGDSDHVDLSSSQAANIAEVLTASTTESAPQGQSLCSSRDYSFRRQCNTNRLQIGNRRDWRLRLSSGAQRRTRQHDGG